MPEKYALIVEDAVNWVKQHQLTLGELGFSALVANDYAEALGLLRRQRFDIAVIDLCLTTHAEPENLNGVFLLEYLVEKNIPVIIVTGRSFRKLVDEIYRKFDVFEILDKLSFNPERFKEYVLQATNEGANHVHDEKKKAITQRKIEELILKLTDSAAAEAKPKSTAPRKSQAPKPMRVFVSHSSKDKNFVKRLTKDLKAWGVEIWYDTDEIRVGDTIMEKIDEGSSRCDYMIVVLSPDAIASWMVRQELLLFLNEEMRRGQRLILPVFYKECEIPRLLKVRRYADFREDYHFGLAELQNSLGVALHSNQDKV